MARAPSFGWPSICTKTQGAGAVVEQAIYYTAGLVVTISVIAGLIGHLCGEFLAGMMGDDDEH